MHESWIIQMNPESFNRDDSMLSTRPGIMHNAYDSSSQRHKFITCKGLNMVVWSDKCYSTAACLIDHGIHTKIEIQCSYLSASTCRVHLYILHMHTWHVYILCKACLSAAKSHKAGAANPVSDSLIPLNSFTRFRHSSISVSNVLIELVYWPAPYITW